MNESQIKPAAYIEVSVTVDHSLSEPVCDFIIENYSSGLVLEDEDDTGLTTIKFYLPESDNCDYRSGLRNCFEKLSSGTKEPIIESRTITNVDWEQQYRQSVQPVRIEPDITIRAPWHEPVRETRYELVLEPKMAFGTGRHETTRSCLKIINQRFQTGWRFLDLGCGSGILSVLAARKGASYIKAIDYDVIAVDNCRRNFELNDVATPSEILFGSIEKCRQDAPYQFVCVNIIKRTILDLLPTLKDLTAPGGVLLLAGLLLHDEAEVSTQLETLGLRDFATAKDNDWLSYIVERQ